ncbi:unnamed protein product [Cercopithifilaria johnstoni]|uniref:Uncharacterized protein n=1 Tax=Cercopithifilaria johnstoni TaxID=2874296 RepID=A0A8J2M6H2_9BILA|nr:unnamed protein product [Cercopithifilaria johnstoni]
MRCPSRCSDSGVTRAMVGTRRHRCYELLGVVPSRLYLLDLIIVWLAVFLPLTSSLGSIAKKTKLCGDEACSEKLFEGKFHRASLATHESFLSPNENDIVSVYAIKFSDRTDLMEGALVREPSKKGNFFSMHINLDDYVEFLKNAVVSNKTMFMVSRDPRDHPSHRLVGIKAALPELIKDYEVNVKRLSVERQLSPEQSDHAALGYLSDIEGHGHSHDYGHRHSFDHGLPHNHEHYHDRSVHADSHEHIRIVQHTRQPILSSEQAAVSPLPVANVASNEPQKTSTGTVTLVHQHEMPPLESDFKVVPEITAQQNLMHGSASSVLLQEAEPISKVTPGAPETVVSGFPSAAKETSVTSENLLPSNTNDTNFAAEGILPQIDSSQEKISLDANIANAQNLLPSQPLQPVSMQQVNTELPHQQVMTTPSSVVLLGSNLPPTPDNILQINFSLSSVNAPLPSISSQTGGPPSTLPPPSLPVASDRATSVPINNAHSDSVHVSSTPSSPPLAKHIAESETSSPSDTSTILIGHDVSPVSVPPRTEPATVGFVASQHDPVTVLSEFSSTVKMELGSRGKNSETTAVNYPLEPSPFPSASPTLPKMRSYVINPSAIEGISHDEQDAQRNSKAIMNMEQGNAEESVQTKEVKADDIENGLDYCLKDECDNAYNTPEADEKLRTEYLCTIRRWLSKLIGVVRYMLPSSINNIDDAGVLVTFFVPICLFIHLLRMLVFADTSDRDNFDRRILHNALTTIRQREVQIMLLHAEMEKEKNAWNTEMDEKFKNLRSEMSQLKAKCHMLEEENDSLRAETDETNQMIEEERLKCRNLTEQNGNLGEKNELLTKQSSEMHVTVEMLHEENERLVSEVAKKSAQLIRIESEAKSYSLEIKNLKDQLETSLSERKTLHQRVEELENEIVQLSEIINEIRDSSNISARDKSSAAKAENGENGWSDFDEFDNPPAEDIPERPKKNHVVSRFSPAEIMEVAKLRVQLKTVEADLDQAKLTLQKQLNERDHLLRKVEFAEAEAAKQLKEVNVKETERIEAQNQFKRILGMVEERETKLRITEELAEKMRNEMIKWQEEVRRLEDQKKAMEFKLLEADQELKRLKAEYAKLETRSFHEIRQCKQTIAALQQQSLEQVRMSNPSSNLLDNANVLNISASSSSDRDYAISLNSSLVAPPFLPSVRPLWGDDPVEIFTSSEESSLLKKVDPLLNVVTTENGNISHNRGSKERRSIREREHSIGVNVDGMQSRHKKEGRRMRSRSHGRHPFRTDFSMLGMPGYPGPSVDFYTGTILNKQNSKSGTLYYSSGGSNDGRSPPPEMALLSGVPPPGPMIKKPMPRPKSSIEPLERR